MIQQNLAAVVLCGGKSSRMGRPKHLLPFGDESVLERVVHTLQTVTSSISVVAAADQELPALDDTVKVVRDEDEYQGPLAGLLMGLHAVSDSADIAYLTGCDTPLLSAVFVEKIVASIGLADVAIAVDEEFCHPLAAVYRTSLIEKVQALYAQGERRPRKLLDQCDTVRIPVAELRTVDPQLLSLQNMNRPEDYELLKSIAGLR